MLLLTDTESYNKMAKKHRNTGNNYLHLLYGTQGPPTRGTNFKTFPEKNKSLKYSSITVYLHGVSSTLVWLTRSNATTLHF